MWFTFGLQIDRINTSLYHTFWKLQTIVAYSVYHTPIEDPPNQILGDYAWTWIGNVGMLNDVFTIT